MVPENLAYAFYQGRAEDAVVLWCSPQGGRLGSTLTLHPLAWLPGDLHSDPSPSVVAPEQPPASGPRCLLQRAALGTVPPGRKCQEEQVCDRSGPEDSKCAPASMSPKEPSLSAVKEVAGGMLASQTSPQDGLVATTH